MCTLTVQCYTTSQTYACLGGKKIWRMWHPTLSWKGGVGGQEEEKLLSGKVFRFWRLFRPPFSYFPFFQNFLDGLSAPKARRMPALGPKLRLPSLAILLVFSPFNFHRLKVERVAALVDKRAGLVCLWCTMHNWFHYGWTMSEFQMCVSQLFRNNKCRSQYQASRRFTCTVGGRLAIYNTYLSNSIQGWQQVAGAHTVHLVLRAQCRGTTA